MSVSAASAASASQVFNVAKPPQAAPTAAAGKPAEAAAVGKPAEAEATSSTAPHLGNKVDTQA